MTAEHTPPPPPERDAVRRKHLGRLVLAIVIPLATVLAFVLAWVSVDPTLTPRQREARNAIRRMEGYLKAYFRVTGHYPTQAESFYPLLQAGLLQEVPRDPWGNLYVYQQRGGSGVILSYGADGRPGGRGEDADITGSGPMAEASP